MDNYLKITLNSLNRDRRENKIWSVFREFRVWDLIQYKDAILPI